VGNFICADGTAAYDVHCLSFDGSYSSACVCVASDLGRCLGPERVHRCSLSPRAAVDISVTDLVRVLFVYSSPRPRF